MTIYVDTRFGKDNKDVLCTVYLIELRIYTVKVMQENILVKQMEVNEFLTSAFRFIVLYNQSNKN